MTGTPAENGYLGWARIFRLHNRFNPPLAWVFPENDFVFTHEIGHIFGCEHNREVLENGNLRDGSNFGYHMGGYMRTIMAYRGAGYSHRIPRFSSKDNKYLGVALGDSRNDNRNQIIRTRFLISQTGEENGNCHSQ